MAKFEQNKTHIDPVVVAEWSKALSQIQVERILLRPQVQIPTWDYDIERSEVEILCHYSNSRAPGDMCRLQSCC